MFDPIEYRWLVSSGSELVALVEGFGGSLRRIRTVERTVRLDTGEEGLKSARATIATETQAVRDAFRATLSEMRETVTARRDKVLRDVAAALRGPAPATTEEKLLRELQEQRLWTRLKPILDSSREYDKAALELIAQACRDADRNTLEVLFVELPAYARARGNPELTTVYTLELEQGLASVDPVAREALEVRGDVESGTARLLAGIAQADYAAEHGETTVVLPAWKKADGAHTVDLLAAGT